MNEIEKTKETIYENIDTIRKARNLSKADLAKAVGVSLPSIYSKDHVPTVEKLVRYCRALGCKMGDILDDVVGPEEYDLPDEDDIERYFPYNAVRPVSGIYRGPELDEQLSRFSPKDFLEAVDSVLSDRQKTIFYLRFRSRLTLEDVAKELNVSRERVRSIEGMLLRLLREPDVWDRYVCVPIADLRAIEKEKDILAVQVATMRARLAALEDREEGSEPVPDFSIKEMDLSVRSYNCLSRAGITCASQLQGMTKEDIRNIRNLGAKSAEEIIERAKEYGIEIL